MKKNDTEELIFIQDNTIEKLTILKKEQEKNLSIKTILTSKDIKKIRKMKNKKLICGGIGQGKNYYRLM